MFTYIFRTSSACNSKAVYIRLETDVQCVSTTLSAAINLIETATEYISSSEKTEETRLLMSCSDSKNYYDSNDARDTDVIARSYSEDTDTTFYSELINNISTSFFALQTLHLSYPYSYRAWLAYQGDEGHIYVNYPTTIDTNEMCSESILCDHPFVNDANACSLDYLYLSSPTYNPDIKPYAALPYLDHLDIYSNYEPLVRIGYPLYIDGEHRGAVGLDLYLDKLLGNLFHSTPTDNGYYLLVDKETYLWGGHPDLIKMIYGPTMTNIEIIYKNNTRLNETNYGFGEIGNAITRQETSTTISISNIEYSIFISSPIQDLVYLVAVVPTTDLTNGAEWSIKESEILFSYLSTDSSTSELFTIMNTGLFTVEYEIDNGGVYTITPSTGSIRGGSVKTISVTLDLANSTLNTPHITIKSVGTLTGTCFTTLSLPVESLLADCKASDFKAVMSECNTDKRNISFHWNEPKSCYGGMSLPDSVEISCGIYIYYYYYIYIYIRTCKRFRNEICLNCFNSCNGISMFIQLVLIIT